MTPLPACLKGTNNFYYYFYFFVAPKALGLYCIHLTKENPSIGPFCSLPHFVKLSVPTNRFIIYIYSTFFGISVLVSILVFQYQPKFDVQVSACMETVYPRKGLNTKHACWHHQLSKYVKGTVSQEHIEIYPVRQ